MVLKLNQRENKVSTKKPWGFLCNGFALLSPTSLMNKREGDMEGARGGKWKEKGMYSHDAGKKKAGELWKF